MTTSEPGKVRLAICTVRTDPQYSTLLGGTKKAVMALSNAEIDAADMGAQHQQEGLKGCIYGHGYVKEQQRSSELAARVQALERERDELLDRYEKQVLGSTLERDRLRAVLERLKGSLEVYIPGARDPVLMRDLKLQVEIALDASHDRDAELPKEVMG